MPAGAVELDYLIADPALRGRGLGARMIAQAVEDTWKARLTAPAVLVAVVAANTASWRALEKAGLQRIAEGRDVAGQSGGRSTALHLPRRPTMTRAPGPRRAAAPAARFGSRSANGTGLTSAIQRVVGTYSGTLPRPHSQLTRAFGR